MSEVKVPEGYKQTEIGVIPEDWNLLLAKEMTSFIGGYSFSSNSAQDNGIRWIKIANVGVNKVKWDAKSYLPYSFSEVHSKYLLKENDVVIALTRPILSENLKIARLRLSDTPSLLNQRVAKLEVTSKGDINFAYYALQTSNFIAAMNLAMAGTDPPNIGTKALSKIQILIPPKQEQTAIANALSDIDDLIGSLEKLIAKKEAIKTGTMQQLLTGKTRLPEFTTRDDGSLKGFKQTELGRIPEDWDYLTLDSMANVRGGKRLPKGKQLVKAQTKHPYIRVADMFMGGVDTTNMLYLTEDTAPLIKNYRIFSNELFISVAGTIGLIGKIPAELDKANLTENADRICNIQGDSTYFLYYLSSQKVQDKILSQITVGAQPKLAIQRINSLDILSPNSIEEQTAIATILADMDAEIQAVQQRLEKTRDIKQGMMQQLLTGKVRLVD
ncbi:restriction endonuclease subunit S [uncultured Psychrobacter sp.]|uniref:restriction endonuclease subunit S n=1 Tax=uncultured Psychrobacter sp. TaxID=259303 RepID=UPI00261B6F1D|nr:restriction endonuclease subunit S [uncultured Psychrobacter sp.]